MANIIFICSVYRNPDADGGIFDCLLVSMAAIQENDKKASFVFIGDFNAHHKEWLNSISQTDCHGLRALDFFSESGCDQIMPLRGIVVSALTWHSLGWEIESCPRVRESFPLNTLWSGYCHYAG